MSLDDSHDAPTSTARRLRQVRFWWFVVVFGVVVFGVGGSPAAFGASDGVTVYVDSGSGSDGRSLSEAQSSGTPWKTLDYAVGQVSAGSTIVALSGSFALNADGISFDPAVVIKGEPGSSIVASFKGSRGFTLTGFFFPEYTPITSSSSIVIKSGESEGGFGIGVGSSYVTLSGMYIHNVDDPNSSPYEKAVSLGGSKGNVSNITIVGSRFSNNPEDSIQINLATNVTIRSNRFTNNGPWNATVPRDQARHSDVVQILGGVNISFTDNTVIGNSNVLVVKPQFGRTIDNLVMRGNYFERNDGYALNIRNVPGSVTVESNTYLCNGVAFKETCGDVNQYAISAQGTPNLVRINDPAGTGGPPPSTPTTTTTKSPVTTTTATTTTTTTKAPADTTTSAAQSTTTTTTVGTTSATPPPSTTSTTQAAATTTTTLQAATAALPPQTPGTGSTPFRRTAATTVVVAAAAISVLYLAGTYAIRKRDM